MITIKGNNYSLAQFFKAGSSVFYHELFLPIFWMPARFMFGNFIGYRDNVVPLVHARVRRIGDQKNEATDRPAHDARVLHENGFIVLPRNVVYPQPEASRALDAIVSKCNELMNGFDSILTRVKGTIFNIYRPLERIPELRHLI